MNPPYVGYDLEYWPDPVPCRNCGATEDIVLDMVCVRCGDDEFCSDCISDHEEDCEG